MNKPKKMLDIAKLQQQAILSNVATTLSPQDEPEIVEENMGLIVSIVKAITRKQTLPTGIEECDLISWGVEGLFKAHKNFKKNKSSKFSTYAFYRIRGEIFDRIREEWSYRNPNSYQENRKKIQGKLADYIEQSLDAGEDLTPEKISTYMQNIIANSTMSFLLSLENLTVNNEPLAPESNESREYTDALQDAIKQLDADEQQLIRLFYSENLSQKDIAKQLNYSNSKVSRIHSKVLEKLRRRLNKKGL